MADTTLPTFYAADMVVFAYDDDMPCVAAIVRGGTHNRGKLALPGGHLEPGEASVDAALREAREETGLDLSAPTFVRRYANPEPAPRGFYVVEAWTITLAEVVPLRAGDDALDAIWLPVTETGRLIFNHPEIVADALRVAKL